MKVRVSNKEFADTVDVFKTACASVGLPNTTRQASKWRMGKGKALKEGKL